MSGAELLEVGNELPGRVGLDLGVRAALQAHAQVDEDEVRLQRRDLARQGLAQLLDGELDVGSRLHALVDVGENFEDLEGEEA